MHIMLDIYTLTCRVSLLHVNWMDFRCKVMSITVTFNYHYSLDEIVLNNQSFTSLNDKKSWFCKYNWYFLLYQHDYKSFSPDVIKSHKNLNYVFLYSSDKPILVRERTSHINHLANMFYSATSGKKSLVLSDNNPLYINKILWLLRMMSLIRHTLQKWRKNNMYDRSQAINMLYSISDLRRYKDMRNTEARQVVLNSLIL